MNLFYNANKVRKNLITVLSLLLILCCIAFVFTMNSKNVVAEKIEISDAIIYDNYSLGETDDLPSFIEFEYKGQTVTASKGYVVFPDNTAVSAGRIALNKLGEYSVSYLFDFGGETHIAQKKFEVTDKLYEIIKMFLNN